MCQSEVTRLTIVWSKDTDVALRAYLRSQGLKKGALSKFVEEAVKWRLFDQIVTEVRQAFANVPADQMENLIDEAVASARKEKHRESKRRSRK